MNTVAVLSIKRFDAAKRRLGDAHFRPVLAKAMMIDVLAALGQSALVEHVVIVSGEPAAQDLGTVIPDPDEGHNPAAARGVAAAVARGATKVLLAAGDCPLIDPAELDALLGRAEDGVTVIADRHGTGTNALILSPPTAIESSFGEGSCARHQDLARRAGFECTVAFDTSMALDVDAPHDLTALADRLRSNEDLAPNTRAVLQAEGLM